MADRIRMSRRRILQLGAMAPLSALAIETANAQSTPPDDIPREAMDDLIRQAVEAGLPASDTETFKKIASDLWRFFQIGACYGGLPLSPNSDSNHAAEKVALIKGAFGASNQDGVKSGKRIIANLNAWETMRDATSACAFLAGKYAAEDASFDGKAMIDLAAYQTAFTRTEKEMKAKLKRCGLIRAKRGGNGLVEIQGGAC